MMAVLTSLVVLILTVTFLIGIPRATQLTESSLKSTNISQSPQQILGIKKLVVFPQNKGLPPPKLSALSSVVKDLDSNLLLFAKDPYKKVAIASTTKIMTALVSAEYFKMDDVLTVDDLSGVFGANMGLILGEKIAFRNLLYGLLLSSGNDAAYTIARSYSGGISGLVEAMNRKAAQLELANTRFDNPAGFDSLDHFSSALDLSEIATLFLKNHQLSWIVATKEATVTSVEGKVTHNLKNLNKLLDLPEVRGIKTGYTPFAKENLVTLVDRNDRRILIVVLGSNDRFGETKALIDWVFEDFDWSSQ